MIVSSFMACLGQLFWKLYADGNIVNLVIGFLLYGLGAIIMIISYKYGSLSVLQPVLSINYVLCLVLGHFFLNEVITVTNMIGVFTIIVGVIFIAGGD